MSKLINQNIQVYRAQVDEIVKDLHELTIHIKHEDLAKTVSDLRNRIHDPFMFVIVGEVKAGKSSFINALLDTGKEVTKVAPQPMTDTIQQIVYGEREEVITINPFLKKIHFPVDILREIAIVDTPGTNTIVEHHQEITENFIPASDLIVFVFEAKNPYRQSSWDFFNFIHEDWRKKIIFVLQQKDLMPAEDLAVNKEGLITFAKKKGIEAPVVFAVSAKEELDGNIQSSGFSGVRDYIQENITGGKAPILKLRNSVETSLNINERIAKGLSDRSKQWEADKEFRKDISETLDHQSKKSKGQVDVLVENLVATYNRITIEKSNELSSGLNFFSLVRRSFASIFNRSSSAKDWLENLAKDLELDLQEELGTRLNNGVVDLADNIQQMAKLIDLKIRSSETILKNDHDIFSDIAEKRSNILQELQTAFANFLSDSQNFQDSALFPDKSTISPNIATGGGMAVIGIILATVTQGMVFDITGGVLTAIGFLFAGFSTRAKRRKIIKGFNEEINKGRTRIETEVSDKLKSYIDNLKGRIDRNFVRFDNMLSKEAEDIEQLNSIHADIDQQLHAIQDKLNQPI